ncbi:MAG: hypothetical protein FJY65_06425 [Calditrichaeota bacterium]|nr:hypothetical protein [Calditrichota bacterium]
MKQVLLLAVLGLLCGCYTTTVSRGKLSDPMNKASDDYKGERVVRTRDSLVVPPESLWVWHNAPGHRYPPPEPAPQRRPLTNVFYSIGFNLSSGLLHGGDFYGYRGGGLSYEMFGVDKRDDIRVNGEKEKPKGSRFDFNVKFASAPLQETSRLNRSLTGGVGLFEIGGDADFFTTPYYTFMGHYFIVSLHYAYMGWSYRNAVRTEEGELIEGDALQGLDLGLGMGWNPMQMRYLHIGLEATTGIILWDTYTREGFENDVFKPFLYLQLSAMLKVNWD